MAINDYTNSFATNSQQRLIHQNDTSSSCSACESTRRPQKAKKSVHFNSSCHLKYFAMPTQEDKSNAWYSEQDYQEFKTNTKCIAMASAAGRILPGEDMLFGLEGVDRDRVEIKRHRRYRVWDIVIDGQFEHPSEQVAELCVLASHESVQHAERTATFLRFALLQEATMQHPVDQPTDSWYPRHATKTMSEPWISVH